MLYASQLRSGVVVRWEGQTYRVVASEYHPGQGKMGGVAHVRLRNVATGALWETSFRAQQKLEQLEVERQVLEFLYADADSSYFMDPTTFEQRTVPNEVIGPSRVFLEPGMQAPVELVEGEPVAVVLPEIVEARIVETAEPAHQAQDNTWKTARLENGVEILVPQFIRRGDRVRVDVNSLRYVDRARCAAR